MKMFIISDNVDTKFGMRLVGIQGFVTNSGEEAINTLNKIADDPEIGIILITFKLASLISDVIDTFRIKRKLPLIVEIPDKPLTELSNDRITKYIKESIGLTIDEKQELTT